MIYVAVCDDEKALGAELERTLIDIFDKLDAKYEIDVYFSGDELHKKMEAGTHYDLIFLDIEFAKNEINGVKVGQLIRDAHHNNTVSIVYMSWKKKYAMQLFDIRPLAFLIKPLKYEKIEKAAKTHLQLSGFWSESFTYKKGHDNFKVQAKDIVYLENNDRKIILHLADGRKEEFYGTLKKIYEEQLKRLDFLFIHTSYIVNYDYVTSIGYNQLTITDRATPLTISQNKRNETRERYSEIVKRRRV